MAKERSNHPTDLELVILKVLWDAAPQTARQIREQLDSCGRSLAHTTVITTLQKMVDKRQLEQLAPIEGKAYRFKPLVDSQRVSQNMLGDLMTRVFDGSAEALMLSLFDVSNLDDDDLKRLRKAFNKKVREMNK